LTAIVAAGLFRLGATPALAAGSQADTKGTLNLWCAPGTGNGVDIHGTLTVPSGSDGPVYLFLFGDKSSGWDFAWQGTVIHTVQGQTTYDFQFNAKDDSNHFQSYRVDGDGASSRVLGRDECGFRVPEAPSSALLLLGATPVAGVVGMRVAGIRLPLPRWRRIA
jgi:hypothetical protein